MKTFTKVILVLFLVLVSQYSFSQWVQLSGISWKVNSFAQFGSTFYACTDVDTYKTTNEGNNWSSVGTSSGVNYSFAVKNTSAMVYSASYPGVRYYSGGLWMTSNISWETRSLITDGTDFYAGTSQGVYKSTNNGQNWTSIGLNSTNIITLLKSGSYMFAGSSAGIFISSNSGGSWVSNSSYNVNCMAYGNNILWLGTTTGLLWSNDYGTIWHNASASTYNSITLNGNEIYVGSSNGVRHIYSISPGVYQGAWRNVGFPTPLPTINALIVTNNYLLAGTDNAVWRSSLSYVTNVEKETPDIPDKYSLYQNFPDPFNPSTTIKYQITKNETVSLKVFDILGHEVVTLVNEKQSPGTYQVNWNAGSLSSGVYFYRLQAGNFIDTKRMTLIK